jgi:hypothetical protein
MEEQDSPKVVLKGALKDIFRELVRFLRWLIAGLIDAGFLAAWAWIQYKVNSWLTDKTLIGHNS